MSSHAIIFLTHILSARVFRHFTRLQKETDGLLFSTFCLHVARPTVGKRLEKVISRFLMPTPRLEIDVKSGARLLPNRYAKWGASTDGITGASRIRIHASDDERASSPLRLYLAGRK